MDWSVVFLPTLPIIIWAVPYRHEKQVLDSRPRQARSVLENFREPPWIWPSHELLAIAEASCIVPERPGWIEAVCFAILQASMEEVGLGIPNRVQFRGVGFLPPVDYLRVWRNLVVHLFVASSQISKGRGIEG